VASKVQIRVGNVAVGGGAPVAVQSMTLTKTHDVPTTTAQIAALASAGCEIVRVAVPKNEDAAALPLIVRLSPIPVIADIHFNASLALKAIDAGVAAVRINPGNIGGPDKVEQVVRAAKKAGIPMRIGANSGSLPKHLHALAQQDQAEALVAAALELERQDLARTQAVEQHEAHHGEIAEGAKTGPKPGDLLSTKLHKGEVISRAQ
jgi:(E)-4-hydroxy-3-methylbut-2-enyl-diphosphate synthase